jgi:alpha-tubulin suppressor-like RCC1 family protein
MSTQTLVFSARNTRFFRGLLRSVKMLLLFLSAVILPQRLIAAEPLVVSGYDFSAYLAADGTVWTWGANNRGQLGDGTTTPHYTPQQVPGLSRVTSISAGYYHVLAVLSDGTMRTWGDNGNGQVGNGTTTQQRSPVDIGLTNIKAVAAGGYHSLALTAAGAIQAWGINSAGELGDGTFVQKTSPVAVVAVGTGGFFNTTITYRSIAGGGSHSLAIAMNGNIYAWGSDSNGQLGDDSISANKNIPTVVSGITNALSIAGGGYHSISGLADGTVRTWGSNSATQLGDGTNIDRYTPVLISSGGIGAVTRVFAGYQHSGCLRVDSYVLTWGSNSNGQCNQPLSSGVVAIPTFTNNSGKPNNYRATGSGLGNHTLYIADDGTVRGWGSNQTGQLGNGASAVNQVMAEVRATTNWSLDAIVAIDAGYSHSIALKADGTVWTWGSDNNGELGDDVTRANKSTPVQVSGLSGVYSIAAGSFHNLALTCNGTMWAWGWDAYGQLGNDAALTDQPTPVTIPGASFCRAIGAGGYHSLAVLYNGQVYAWGYNGYGELGDGTNAQQTTPKLLPSATLNNMIELDGGVFHSIGRQANGLVFTWGNGGSGQIGDGGSVNQSSPIAVFIGFFTGGAVSVTAGQNHSAVTMGSGAMYSWGADYSGQLGNDSALTAQPSPVFVSSLPPHKRVTSGGYNGNHTLILEGDGTVSSVGSDAAGQLGNNSSLTDQPLPVTVAGLSYIVSIAAGDFHSLALRHDGVVFSWGQGTSGQLGNNAFSSSQPTPVITQSSWLPTITYNSAASLATASESSAVDGTVVFTRTLVNAGSIPITYSVGGTAIEGVDYSSLPNPRRTVITSNATSTSVTIDPIDNFVAADPKTVVLTPLASSGYQLGSPTVGTVIISDNDVEGIIVSSTNSGAPTSFTSLITTEAAGSQHTFTFYIKLNSQPTGTVTIPIDSSNYSEGRVNGVLPLLLSFTGGVGGNWAMYQAVTVTGLDDSLVDGNISYTISIGQPTTTDARYAVINPPDISAVNKDDDLAGVEVETTFYGAVAVTEAAGVNHARKYRLRLNSQPPLGNNVTITLAPDSQITVNPSTLTFTNNGINNSWNNYQEVTVTAVDDALAEGAHTGTVSHTASGGGYGAVTITNLTASITDNDTAYYLLAKKTSTTGTSDRLITTESGGQGKFTIVLTSQPTGTVTIPVSSSLTSEGIVSTSSVQFTTATWDQVQTITVTGQSDGIDDGDQDYQIVFGTPASTDSKYSALTSRTLLMVNQNIDAAKILVDLSSVVTSETGGATSVGVGTSSTFNVVLNCKPVSAVTVTITATAGFPNTQHTISTTSLVFNPSGANLWSTPQPVTLTGVNNSNSIVPSAYQITLTATTASAEYLNKNAVVTALNQDDDSAGISVSSTALTVTEANGINHSRNIRVRLTSAPTTDVILHFTSSDTNAVTISPSTLTFTNGNWSSLQSIVVTGVNDDIDQGSTVSTNKISIITGVVDPLSDAAFTPMSVTVSPVTITVTDNDTAALVLSSSVLVTTEAGSSALLSVRLATEPVNPVTVTITGLDATEGSLSTSTLNFTVLNWATVQNVIITGLDDQVEDGNISYNLTLTASSTDALYAGKTGTVTIINTDDDASGIEILDGAGSVLLASTLTTTEIGGTAQFSMRLKSQPTGNVTISLVSSNTAEGTLPLPPLPFSLTFTPADWNDATAHVVTITGQSDLQDDGNITYSIVTEAASSADPLYNTLNAADVTVINTDNIATNRAGFTLSTPSLTISEVAGTGPPATFTVMLKSQPANNVTIFLASSDTTEGTVSPSVLTFTSSNWNEAQTATVTAEDDIVSDGPQSFSVVTTAASGDPKYNVGDDGISDVMVITTDDEIPALTVTPLVLTTTEASGGSHATTFSISLACQPTVPVTVNLAITPGSNEGTLSTSALTFSASTWFVPQFVTVTGVDDDVNDGDKSYAVVATASGAEYASVTASIAVTNTDDDSPGVVVTPISGLTTTELGGTANFTVRLTSQPLSDVTITVISNNNAEGIVATGGVPLVLTFTAGNWDQTQTVIVTGVDDVLVDGDVAYQITAAATSSDGDYHGFAITSVSVTNTDDETLNLAPVAVASTFSTVVNLTINEVLLGSDPENTVITFELGSTVPTQGTLTLVSAATGAFTFVPPVNTRGDYTFTYRVQDATGKYSPYATVTLHISGGDDLRPQVIQAPPMETENGPQTATVKIDPLSKAGSTALSSKAVNIPAGITVSVQALSSPTSFQVNYQINSGTLGDHFSFGILIIDHDRPAATLLPVMIQRVTPLGPG